MGGILEELGNNGIIGPDAVLRLKGYIARKNPEASVARRAAVLADALDRALTPRLPELEEALARKLKRRLFEHAVSRPSFQVTCSDVFTAAVELEETGDQFFSDLYAWISENLGRRLPIELLVETVRESHVLLRMDPDGDIREMVAKAETTAAWRMENEILLFAGAAEPDPGSFQSMSPEDTKIAESESAASMEILSASPERPETVGNEALEPYAVLGHFSDIFAGRHTPGKNRRNEWKMIAAATAVSILILSIVFPIFRLSGNPVTGTPYPAEPGAVVAEADVTRLVDEALAAGVAESPQEQILHMKATAYDLSYESCGKRPGEPGYGITSTGTKARIGRTVAVDPEVIPLGSRLQITFPKEYSHLDGEYIAEDTGRLIKGSTIDIFFGEDKSGSTAVNEAAMEFGVRFVDVRILE